MDCLGGEELAAKKMKSNSGWENYTIGGNRKIKCPNCLTWNSEYRRKVPCHVCRDNRYLVINTPEEVHSGNGTNESGFNGLPAGCVWDSGETIEFGFYGYWWSSTVDKSIAAGRRLDYNEAIVDYSEDENNYGSRVQFFEGFNWLSVRCIKD